ncbi:MAG: hypothetical protein ACOYMA_07210 [Bacteroidia bacterium]
MKQITKLITIISLIAFFNSCSPECPKHDTVTNYVDKGFLPFIMPYSDTSTRLFLKNGKDTLIFRSQGIKETFLDGSTLESDCPKNFNLQQLSLLMLATDSDYFRINYYSNTFSDPRVTMRINNQNTTKEYSYESFKYYYPPIVSLKVLNNLYDTVRILKLNYPDSICLKPKIGIIKIKTTKVTYELIN